MRNLTFWCEECWKAGKIPKGVPPLSVNYPLTFKNLYYLTAYLEGDRDLDTLDAIEDLEDSLKWELYKILKKALRDEEV